MSKEKKVWIGTLNSSHVKTYPIDANFPNLYEYHVNKRFIEEFAKNTDDEFLRKQRFDYNNIACEIASAYRNFNKLDVLPDALWCPKMPTRFPNKNDTIFSIGYTIFLENTVNLFKKFRLGETTLTPVQIFSEKPPKQPLLDNYYFLNLCEHRHFIKEKQTDERLHYYKDFVIPCYKSFWLEKDMVEIDKSALTCDLDFWHDPLYRGSYFFSDDFHQALIDAKLHRNWEISSCKLV